VTALAVALAFGSALLHAAWNLRLKTSADPLRVAAVAVPLGSALLTVPVGVAWLALGRPGLPWQAWALAALSGLVELGYWHFLSRAYRRGDVSSVYPVARGSAPVLAALIGLLVLRERLAPVQLVGVAVLVAGIWLARPPVSSRRALAPALLTGVLIATYTTVDRLGVRLGPFWLYTWAVFVATSLWLLPWARGTGAGRAVAAQAAPVGVLTVGAYGLTLAALSLAPLALVAPLRESGVIVVALWGVWRLGERERATLKVAGAAAVLAGATLLAVG
jgi:drug/metabolite transporter (DMT)-like permease